VDRERNNRDSGTVGQGRWIARIAVGVLLAVSIVLFLASLTQDGFYIDREDPRAWASCIGLLLVGWLGVIMGVPAWLANPFLVGAWVLACFRRMRWIGLCCALISLAFMLSFLLHGEIMTDEAGGYSKITGYGAGYWLWVASAAAALVGSLIAILFHPGGRNSGS
jgi:hypothetical protein